MKTSCLTKNKEEWGEVSRKIFPTHSFFDRSSIQKKGLSSCNHRY